MPNAVGEALIDKQALGVHTEMITSSMGKLLREGVITNSRKNFNTGKTIGAFAWGDQKLYDYMAENTSVCLRRAAWVNDPFNIARNDNTVSVNTTIQIDLTGQVCSESVGPRQFSGTGALQILPMALSIPKGAGHYRNGFHCQVRYDLQNPADSYPRFYYFYLPQFSELRSDGVWNCQTERPHSPSAGRKLDCDRPS